jgi:transposase
MTPKPHTITHFLGVDVAKDTLALALVGPGQKSRTKSVRNGNAGYAALLSWTARSGAAPEHIHVCLEASGGYEEASALALLAAGCRVSVVNPRRTAAYAQAQMQRSKTDRADSLLLARFCEREQPEPWTPPSEAMRELRRLTRALEAMKRDRDRLRNRHGRSEGAAAEAFDAVLQAYAEQIAALEAAVDAHVSAHSELAEQRALLETIPGVGKLSASVVIAELGSTEFRSARSVAAFAGLVPRQHRSGTSVQKRSRLSKTGNARLRKALYFPALSAMRSNPAVQAQAERLRARGLAKMAVVGAAMRKLVQICYGVLSSGKPFDASLHPTT